MAHCFRLMEALTVGDIVQNSIQRATVRWLGSIEEIPIIGLQSIDSILPGYTDGTCPFNNKRYFDCPSGQGYYILESSFNNSYKIIQKKTENNKINGSDDEFNSAEQSLSTSPVNRPISPQPIPSAFSPSVSQIHQNSDNNQRISPSRGVLSRLNSERDQRKTQTSPSVTTNENSFTQPTSPRQYHPENYSSTSYDRINTEHNNENDFPSIEILNNNDQLSSTTITNSISSFGHEYYLNTWTFGRIKSLLENDIPLDNQFCLNIYEDQCTVQNLIDEQINQCVSLLPIKPPNDIRIELIKLFNHVEVIFPSRAIRLYGNDYLLLAILCSNNQCAYIRTLNGWAYTDEENDNDNGQSIVVDEISQMIDHSNNDSQYDSEQCRHVLKNASFLYYKLVE